MNILECSLIILNKYWILYNIIIQILQLNRTEFLNIYFYILACNNPNHISIECKFKI